MDFLGSIIEQQQYNQMQYQQQMDQMQMMQMMQNQQINNMQHMRKTTRKDIIEWFQYTFNTRNIVQIDEFETQRARHICPNTKTIRVLELNTYNLQTSEGILPVRYFYCPLCGELILDKSSLQMI